MTQGVYPRTEFHRNVCRENSLKRKNFGIGGKLSLEHRLKLSISHKGQKQSTETRAKRSIALSGKNNPAWQGGAYKSRGYVTIYSPDHPHKTKDNRVLEHRIVVEKILKRYLHAPECIHHINKIKNDNSPENLIAFTSHSVHKRFEWGKEVNPSEIIFDGREHGKGA